MLIFFPETPETCSSFNGETCTVSLKKNIQRTRSDTEFVLPFSFCCKRINFPGQQNKVGNLQNNVHTFPRMYRPLFKLDCHNENPTCKQAVVESSLQHSKWTLKLKYACQTFIRCVSRNGVFSIMAVQKNEFELNIHSQSETLGGCR